MVIFAGEQRELSRAYHNQHLATLERADIASEKGIPIVELINRLRSRRKVGEDDLIAW